MTDIDVWVTVGACLTSVDLFSPLLPAAGLTLGGLALTTQSTPGFAAAPATTAPGTPGTSPAPPGTPGIPVASAVTTSSLTLTWVASGPGSLGVAGYRLTYGLDFSDALYQKDLGKVLTTTITGLSRASQYTFRLIAYDDLNHQSHPASVTVETPFADTGDTTPPSAPGGLSAVNGPGGLTLTWQESSDDIGVAGYEVFRFDGWYSSQVVGTTTGTTLTTPSTSDIYYVRAKDAAGNLSIASNTVTAGGTTTTTPPVSTPPPPPPFCHAVYSNTAEWTHGFTAAVTVTNVSPLPVTGWTVTFTYPGDQRIASSWNGTYAQSGAAVTLTNASWNATIAPNGSATVGLLGSWTAADTLPAAILLNGHRCS